jgi:hypothetical protein
MVRPEPQIRYKIDGVLPGLSPPSYAETWFYWGSGAECILFSIRTFPLNDKYVIYPDNRTIRIY